MPSRPKTRPSGAGTHTGRGPTLLLVLSSLLALLLASELVGELRGQQRNLALQAEAALDFDLNELPPEALEEAQGGGDEDDELAAPDELDDEEPLAAAQSSTGAGAHHDGPAPMEGLEESAAAPARPTSRLGGIWSAMKQKLPKYFDFGEFARKFGRQYKATEAAVRRSIFVARCVEIFKARVAYRMGRSGYLQAVNKFSDRTRDEMALLYMPAPPPEFTAPGGFVDKQQRDYVSKLGERKRLLESPESERAHLMEVDTQGSAGEDEETRAKRELDDFYQREEALTFSRDQEEAMARALEEELRELGIETMTQGGGGGPPGHNLPWPGQLRSADAMELDAQALVNAPYVPPVDRLEANQAGLDWSQHECFHEIYDQGKKCGKCYVLAVTSLAEFYKCSEGGGGNQNNNNNKLSLRKFSKHYVLDCAQKYAPTVMGCAGGSPLDTLRFIAQSGIYNIKQWTQKRGSMLRDLRAAGELAGQDELNLRCPLDPMRTPFAEWAPIALELNPKPVGPNGWLEALEDGPLVATVQMPAEGLEEYAGGVHDGAGCATSGKWHSMVLVGYGQGDRGEPYWRFRNSFGSDWGDAGHFHLDMRVPAACILGGVRVYREPLDSRL